MDVVTTGEWGLKELGREVRDWSRTQTNGDQVIREAFIPSPVSPFARRKSESNVHLNYLWMCKKGLRYRKCKNDKYLNSESLCLDKSVRGFCFLKDEQGKTNEGRALKCIL